MSDHNETDTEYQERTGQLAVWRPLPALPQRDVAETNLEYVERLMELLPPASEDVIDSIAGQILEAETMAEQNAVWDATGSKDAVGRQFIFHSVHLQPSDYDEALLPYYLVCRVTDRTTGERTVLTTGSLNVMVALVKAQVLGQLPWEAEIVGPRRTPKTGRIPLHLRWIAKVYQPEESENT